MPARTIDDPFNKAIQQGVRKGKLPLQTKEAIKWYRKTASKMNVNTNKIFRDADRMSSNNVIGSMYLFKYDAKHKATLPYWDAMPLIFPFRKVSDGFYGINLHYLPLGYRAQLMDMLYNANNVKEYDDNTKIKMSYNILKGMGGLVKPCVKRYLSNHTASRFVYIYPAEWDIALFLPVENFQKQSNTQVWKDSRKIAGV